MVTTKAVQNWTPSSKCSGGAPPPTTRRVSQPVLVAVVLSVHAASLAWIGLRNSPAGDEAGHLSAGIYIWHFGKFDLYRVNPPFVRAAATIPVVLSSPKTDWSRFRDGIGDRTEWRVGQSLIAANGERTFWFYTWARWACIPFCLLGAFICYKWARELYGPMSGVVALLLWCFSPNILAWGATICPAATSALGVTASYTFWRWLKQPSIERALASGLALGILLLSKMTWIILFAVWPILWIVWVLQRKRGSAWRQAGQLSLVMICAVYILNLGYAFEGSLKPLGDYTFASRSLAGADSLTDGGNGGNRFHGHVLARVPIPLPENYVRGIDVQKWDFERGKWSFLCGEWKLGGWWYYYIVCAVLKVPLGTWLLAALAVIVSIRAACRTEKRTRSHLWSDEFVLLAPAIVVFVLVSSETGFSRYFRYVLPCLPLLFIWISKVGQLLTSELHFFRAAVTGALAWSISTCVFTYPHCMSYFNEFAGGPLSGHRYLIDANIDWGQDAFYLKEWLKQNPQARPISLARRDFFDPTELGLQWRPMILSPATLEGREFNNPHEIGPEPGWHAVSVHLLQLRTGDYAAFLEFEPIARAGYSIYIYRLSLPEINAYRRKMGLPAWSPEPEIVAELNK